MPDRAPLFQAPAEKLRLLRELQERARAAEAERMRHVDVFGLLEYEPNCSLRHAVRVQVAAELGIESPFDPAVVAAAAGRLPAACGQCPQELFHQATEFDVLYGGGSVLVHGKVCSSRSGRVLSARGPAGSGGSRPDAWGLSRAR
jgi:hypothetical protein